MQHYDQTRCVTDTELSHELGAVRLDGFRPHAQPHDIALVALLSAIFVKRAAPADRRASCGSASRRRSLAAADLPPVPTCTGLCRY
jgi:hypothetical protein